MASSFCAKSISDDWIFSRKSSRPGFSSSEIIFIASIKQSLIASALLLSQCSQRK
jgi:hypothetical protein